MQYTCISLVLLLATAGFADTLTLRNGRTVNGTVLTLSGTPREIKIDVGGKIETYNVSDVSSVSFSAPGVQSVSESSREPDLTGTWTGTSIDPNGGSPFKVTIQISEEDQHVVATLVGPWGVYLPSGTVAFSGTHKSSRFSITQLCAYPGFQNPSQQSGQITVLDKDRFLEVAACSVNVTFARVK